MHPLDRLRPRPLEDDWQRTLDSIARSRGWSTSREPARLSAELATLSAAYNRGSDAADEARAVREAPGARLVFSFVRDVPKVAGAVRELVASGLLRLTAEAPLRVLDLGAGLGASTWGLARALEAAGGRGTLEATWVDEDAQALAVGQEIVRARAADASAVGIQVKAVTAGLGAGSVRGGPFDVVLLGQVLSEHGRGRGDRLELHVELVRALVVRALAPGGSVVIVEPALRDRTRHLHALRDALIGSAGGDAVTVFAPCLHAAPCPALASPGDWCHEDLGVDLPPWLVPVARGAGLRWQGLTFSYLVLRGDGRTLRGELAGAGAGAGGRFLRVVSGALVSKGKREVFVCGELGEGEVGRVKARRLDRDDAPGNEAWDGLARGDLIAIEPPLSAVRPRVDREGTVRRVRLPIDGEPRPR
jgi:SAM-dependent methyltransferase